jgi:hypothetical protein
VKIDDSASYCTAACWADVIDNEVQRHVSSLSLQANGGHSKGSAEVGVVRTHGRFAMASQPNWILQPPPCEFVETCWVKYPQYPQYGTSVELGVSKIKRGQPLRLNGTINRQFRRLDKVERPQRDSPPALGAVSLAARRINTGHCLNGAVIGAVMGLSRFKNA